MAVSCVSSIRWFNIRIGGMRHLLRAGCRMSMGRFAFRAHYESTHLFQITIITNFVVHTKCRLPGIIALIKCHTNNNNHNANGNIKWAIARAHAKIFTSRSIHLHSFAFIQGWPGAVLLPTIHRKFRRTRMRLGHGQAQPIIRRRRGSKLRYQNMLSPHNYSLCI